MSLRCEHLAFAYRAGRPVLADITLALSPGRLCVILGPNGSGKSTLLRLLLGALSPTAGRVMLGDRAVGSIALAERSARITYIAQSPALAESFTVRQAVALGRLHAGENADAVTHALAQVDLADAADEPVWTLSAGQQQRVGVARALAQLTGRSSAAAAILADEPCSAMDPRHAILTMTRLREQARAGVAVAVVLHDMPLAAAFADDALLLTDRGAALALGTAIDVLAPEMLSRAFGVEFAHFAETPARAGARPIPAPRLG